MYYAIGVGKGWVEIRHSNSPPKSCLTSIRVGDRLHSYHTFRGGQTKAMVPNELIRSRLKKSINENTIKRITIAEMETITEK